MKREQPLKMDYLKTRLITLHGATPEQADAWLAARFDNVRGYAIPKKIPVMARASGTGFGTIQPTVEVQNGPCVDCDFWGVATKTCLIDKKVVEMKCDFYELKHDE